MNYMADSVIDFDGARSKKPHSHGGTEKQAHAGMKASTFFMQNTQTLELNILLTIIHALVSMRYTIIDFPCHFFLCFLRHVLRYSLRLQQPHSHYSNHAQTQAIPGLLFSFCSLREKSAWERGYRYQLLASGLNGQLLPQDRDLSTR